MLVLSPVVLLLKLAKTDPALRTVLVRRTAHWTGSSVYLVFETCGLNQFALLHNLSEVSSSLWSVATGPMQTRFIPGARHERAFIRSSPAGTNTLNDELAVVGDELRGKSYDPPRPSRSAPSHQMAQPRTILIAAHCWVLFFSPLSLP
ncbi:hypothetical protein IF2G_06787 [Cordyceps javanica]|nr:hypothetical protein IF2G_06787 [Cordyceps javanica]